MLIINGSDLMKRKCGFKTYINRFIYDRPCANKKIICIKKSFDEVFKILNSSKCKCK
ncbi:MAG: hypothetical protein RSD97_08425 [Lachnospiraceae bacterium]